MTLNRMIGELMDAAKLPKSEEVLGTDKTVEKVNVEAELLMKSMETFEIKMDELRRLKTEAIGASAVKPKVYESLRPADVFTSVLRKQFRISGPVGQDKLNYVTVCRQIREGQENGFTEKEIVSGVLNAVSDKRFRNYLEMTESLTLKFLCEQLRLEYKEKNAN